MISNTDNNPGPKPDKLDTTPFSQIGTDELWGGVVVNRLNEANHAEMEEIMTISCPCQQTHFGCYTGMMIGLVTQPTRFSVDTKIGAFGAATVLTEASSVRKLVSCWRTRIKEL